MPKTRPALYAQEKVWATEDMRTLVKDGDPKAAVLIAARSQMFAPETLDGLNFENVDEFFNEDRPQDPERRVNIGHVNTTTNIVAPPPEEPPKEEKSSIHITRLPEAKDAKGKHK